MTFYLIRAGWNAANQSGLFRPANPANRFQSGYYQLVGIVEADTPEQACEQFEGTVYNNQHLFAESNPRAIKGLAQAIREYETAKSLGKADS